MKYKFVILLIVLLLSPLLVSAAQSTTPYSFNLMPGTTFNNNTAFVNASSNWITASLGPLNDVNTSQFFSDSEVLNINQSWGSTVWCELTGCNITGNLDVVGDTNVGGDINVVGDTESGTFTLNGTTINDWSDDAVGTNVTVNFGSNQSNTSQNIVELLTEEGIQILQIEAIAPELWTEEVGYIRPTDSTDNVNITGDIISNLINTTGTDEFNYMEGNLSVFELIVRSPGSIILGGINNITGEAFSTMSATGFNLNLTTQQFSRRIVTLDKDFLMTVNRTNGTIYLASSHSDNSEFSIAITDAVNAVGWGNQVVKMSVNWERPHLNMLLGHNGEYDIRTTNTDLIAGPEGMRFGFMGTESFDEDFDITGFNNITDVIFLENSFGANPFLTTFYFDVNFTNGTFFQNITAENITATDTVFSGDVFSQGLFDRIDNVTEIDSDVIFDLTLPVLYAADTTNNEITINITFGTNASFQVWDAEKKFNSNSVFVNVLNIDGVTIDHTAELDTRNRAFQFYFNGTFWFYGEIGRGQFVAIASAHDSIADFGNLIQESDNHTDLTITGSMEFIGDGTSSQNIILIDPTSMLESDANWKGVFINGSALDPTGEGADIVGFEVDFSNLNTTNNPVVHGMEITVAPRLDAIHIHEGQFVIDNKPTSDAAMEFAAMDIRIDAVNLNSSSVWSALSVTAVGDSTGTIAAVLARNKVEPIRQEISTFTTPSQTEFAGRKISNGTTWVDGVDGVEIFIVEGDEVYLGSSAQFSQIEIIMGTIADKDVQPTFWYNTAADAWTEFFPDDETSGFQSSSIVSWEPDAISGLWTSNGDPGAGDSTAGYWIKIIRVREVDEGTPTPTTMKTGTVEAFGWNAQGALSIMDLTMTGNLTTSNGGKLWSNATCTFLSSPDGSAQIEVCNS